MATDDKKRPTYAVPFIKGDWDRAVYTDSPHIDNLMSAFLGMGAEHWALKRRMMVLEQFLKDKKVIDLAKVEAYDPPPEVQVAWEKERDDYITRVFSVLTRDTSPVGGNPPIPKK